MRLVGFYYKNEVYIILSSLALVTRVGCLHQVSSAIKC